MYTACIDIVHVFLPTADSPSPSLVAVFRTRITSMLEILPGSDSETECVCVCVCVRMLV